MSDQEKLVSEVNYDLSFLKRPKWIIIYSVVAAVIIISKIPLASQIDKLITRSMIISSRCQLQMSDYGLHIFPLPHVRVTNLNVPKSCLQNGKSDILLNEVRAYFRGPSFSPFGVLFKVETTFEKIPLEVYVTAGTSTLTFVMKDSLISLDKISNFLPDIKLSGQVKTDFFAQISGNKLKALELNLQSKTLNIPAQTAQVAAFPLSIPPLNIQDMHIVAATDAKLNIQIKKLVLGNETSPIRTQLSGTVTLSPNTMQTKLNIKGQLALSDEILQDGMISLVDKNFLQTFDKVDNFYQININDSIGGLVSQVGKSFGF